MIGAEQSLLPKVTKVWTGCKTWLGQGQDSHPVVAGNCPVTTYGNWFADDPAEALLMGPAERADVIVDFTGHRRGDKDPDDQHRAGRPVRRLPGRCRPTRQPPAR